MYPFFETTCLTGTQLARPCFYNSTNMIFLLPLWACPPKFNTS